MAATYYECPHCKRELEGGELCNCQIGHTLHEWADELIELSARSGYPVDYLLDWQERLVRNHDKAHQPVGQGEQRNPAPLGVECIQQLLCHAIHQFETGHETKACAELRDIVDLIDGKTPPAFDISELPFR